MSLSVHFSARDFSSPILTGFKADPIRMDWTAYGGPEKAQIKLLGNEGELFQAACLLRCPVMVNDHIGSQVWWGFVEEVIVFWKGVRFTISLENLYNKVSVRYAFISPDNKLGEGLDIAPANDIPSQIEFGIKEITLHRSGIADDFAENLRDTFLLAAAWPKSTLSQRTAPGQTYALVNCAGWIKTLAWQSYKNSEGFYANAGPGPGVFSFGQSASYRTPTQVFTPGAAGSLKYAYFQLRGVGNPTRNLNAQLRDIAGTLLATSAGVSGSILSSIGYTWVKFSFAVPFTLVGGTTYMIGVTANTTDPVRYFAIRTDENENYSYGNGCYFNGASWVNLPSITNPGGVPDLLFRALCITDTGSQISAIANAGNQFFTRITAPSSGVLTCPYRDNGSDCLDEINGLMALGTTEQRKILASVSPERQLVFYEQPDPAVSTVFMDARGYFYTYQGTALSPCFPPVGQFAGFSGSNRLMLPFDKNRVPACFVESASYWPQTGKVRIN